MPKRKYKTFKELNPDDIGKAVEFFVNEDVTATGIIQKYNNNDRVVWLIDRLDYRGKLYELPSMPVKYEDCQFILKSRKQ